MKFLRITIIICLVISLGIQIAGVILNNDEMQDFGLHVLILSAICNVSLSVLELQKRFDEEVSK